MVAFDNCERNRRGIVIWCRMVIQNWSSTEAVKSTRGGDVDVEIESIPRLRNHHPIKLSERTVLAACSFLERIFTSKKGFLEGLRSVI